MTQFKVMSQKATHFRIIGLRPTKPGSPLFNDEEYMSHVNGIHKALAHRYDWLYLYNGIEVAWDDSYISFEDRDVARDFSFYDTGQLKISISAIVGKNGSGKSSYVELLVRIINNLSAALLGERMNFATAEHLHYIDYLYADLLIQIENKFYIISVAGRCLFLKEYSRRSRKNSKYFLDEEKSLKLLSMPENQISRNDLLKKHRNGRGIMRRLFYTIVCNYSLYGFNYHDFKTEMTPKERLGKLIKNVDNLEEEERIWLRGIFHKNDGYQTPIVLHPFRHNGQLDIVRENTLALERLLSLLFYRDKSGEFPMRTINDNLKVVALKINLVSHRKYSKENMLSTLQIGKNRNAYIFFDDIYITILSFWDKKFGLSAHKDCLHYEEACDYIVYKTLKIVNSYKKYNGIFRYLSRTDFNHEILSKMLTALLKDNTHITRKLHQTINYIIDPIFDSTQTRIDISDIDEEFDLRGLTNKAGEALRHLPPPIFKTEIILERVSGNVADDLKIDYVPFSGMSSGERQMVYTISNIVYHLTNVDSEWDDSFDESSKLHMIRYQYMNIILDEVELYFHPEMQRIFVYSLTHTLQCIRFKKIRGINILFVTHSPFILSDVPSKNVLALGDSVYIPDYSPEIRTYGANIMEMLADTFFMTSSIGECVRQEISELVKYHIQLYRNNDMTQKNEYLQKHSQFKQLAKCLSDNFWRNTVTKMIKEIEAAIKS